MHLHDACRGVFRRDARGRDKERPLTAVPVNLDRSGAGVSRLGNADHQTIDCIVEMGGELEGTPLLASAEEEMRRQRRVDE